MSTITIESTLTHVNGSAKGRVSASDNGRLIHEDRIDLTSAGSRKRFASAVAGKMIDPDAEDAKAQIFAATLDVDALLLQKLTQLRQASMAPPEDLDVSHIVRPDLFITNELMGLAVPAFSIVDGKPEGRWRLYLRWSDGRREVRDLAPNIVLPDGTTLWIHPEPSPPPPDQRPFWSAKARKGWLSGLPAPNPAELFYDLCKIINHYVDLPEEDAHGVTATVALWIMLTYVFQVFDAVPYLYGGGAPGSGKTRLFIELVTRLAHNPVTSSNISASAMFRRLHDRGGTLLLDEAEQLKEGTPAAAELRSMLLAGYKRGGKATRNEPVGDGLFRQVEFDVFGPKTIVCVKGLPSALASRCISTVMFKSPPGSDKPRRRLDEHAHVMEELRDNLHAWALEQGGDLRVLATHSDVCPPMSGRHYELWQPLLALAWWMEQHGVRDLLALVQRHALKVIDRGQEDQTPEVDETLLRLLTEAVRAFQTPMPSELLSKAKEADADTFRNWTPRGVSNTLRRYGIITGRSHGIRTYRDVTLEQLTRIQSNYGIELGLETHPIAAAPAAPD